MVNKVFMVILILIALAGCNTSTKQTNDMENTDDMTGSNDPGKDTTPKVTGIGGIFFFSENPQEIKQWYSENLGLEVNEWGSSFEFRNAHRPDEINYLQWSPFERGSEYFEPSKKEFMINYRVQNIEGLVENLRSGGVTILDEIATYEYGKFVHIMDIEGNKIELWEPVDRVFTEMGGKTTK
jgi:predicted enzyme related to lactoylglutathione lyase